MSSSDRARDTINLVAATVDTRLGVIEHAIFCPDLVDSRAPTCGIIFTEDILKIAGQQGRYAIGHGHTTDLTPNETQTHLPLTEPSFDNIENCLIKSCVVTYRAAVSSIAWLDAPLSCEVGEKEETNRDEESKTEDDDEDGNPQNGVETRLLVLQPLNEVNVPGQTDTLFVQLRRMPRSDEARDIHQPEAEKQRWRYAHDREQKYKRLHRSASKEDKISYR